MNDTTPRRPRATKSTSQASAQPKSARAPRAKKAVEEKSTPAAPKSPVAKDEPKKLVPPRRTKPAQKGKPRHLAAVPDGTADAAEPQQTPPPEPAEDMGARAKRLWREIVTEFELRPDELEVLASACYAAQRAHEIRNELAGMDILLPGSMGQLVANPLLSEVRNHESHVAAMLGKLKLKETESGVTSTRSGAARTAAKARWTVPHHGATT